MGLLGLNRQKGFVGVDLGTAGIKVVVVNSGRFVAKGMVQVPPGGWQNTAEMVGALAKAVRQTGSRCRKAVAAIGGEQVIARYLRLPRMPERDLRAGLRYEAAKYLPMGTQDLVLDFTVLDDELRDQPEKMNVLLAAAPRDKVVQYYNLFREAGLKLEAIDLVPAALCRTVGILGEKKEALILDIGERWSHVVLTRGGKLLFSRVIKIGCQEITKTSLPTGINPAADLAQEIRRTVDFYRSQSSGEFIPQRLWLSGGGAYLENIKDYLSLEFGLSVWTASPFSLGPEHAVAAGLALRER